MTKKPSKPPEWAKDFTDADEAPYVAKPRVVSEKKTNITFFLARSTHTQMKEIALARNTSLQQLVAEAVDQWLANQSNATRFKPKDE